MKVVLDHRINWRLSHITQRELSEIEEGFQWSTKNGILERPGLTPFCPTLTRPVPSYVPKSSSPMTQSLLSYGIRTRSSTLGSKDSTGPATTRGVWGIQETTVTVKEAIGPRKRLSGEVLVFHTTGPRGPRGTSGPGVWAGRSPGKQQSRVDGRRSLGRSIVFVEGVDVS